MTSFYNNDEALDAYLSHRHADVTSPNLVMEDPAFWAEIGAVDGLDIVELTRDSHDLVVSRMALHYVTDLASVLANIRGGLRPGGRLVFTAIHPVLTAARQVATGQRTSVTVDHYFDRGARERAWFGSSVTWQHRTVEDYVGAVLEAGFELSALRECEPVEALFNGDLVELERRRRAPVFLLISARLPAEVRNVGASPSRHG